MSSFKCFIVVICLVKIGESCDFDFNTDFPTNPPLILNNHDISLIIPTNGPGNFKGVHLNVGEEILLACAGDKNKFQNKEIRLPSIVLKCEANNVLKNGLGERFDFKKDLGCKERTKSDIQGLNETCANNQAELYQIGFNVVLNSKRNYWYPTITSCFDQEKSKTFYSKHEISGLGLSAAQTGSKTSVNFLAGNKRVLYPDFSPEQAYRQETVNHTLNEILGSNAAEHITSTTFFIHRGHLAPNADFFYDTVRFSTFYYINAAPQWNTVNRAWLKLENYVRNLAEAKKKNFTIWTGTHGILTFLDAEQQQEEVYLFAATIKKHNKLPIPKFFWKIVQDPKERKGVAFVSYNNDTSKSSDFTWPCTGICDTINWDINDTDSTDQIICCDVNDLKRKVPEIPEVDVGNGILKGKLP